MKTIEEANHYLMQLPPHVKAREAAKIIEKLVKELEAYKEVAAHLNILRQDLSDANGKNEKLEEVVDAAKSIMENGKTGNYFRLQEALENLNKD